MAMNLRLTREVGEKLDALAAMDGASKQQVISNLISERFERETAREFAERELSSFFNSRQDLMNRLRDA
ncbi:hypothetical protein [Corynebacterium urinipleomorphum]|uniref:hypothetical protein n=1 Tax=Corynebacterium urinipleomorphum TaxID=1852380 RepID=UPI000B35E10A|nr:hypothetical protein [Corynebacterium urinipleomorphum]